GPRAGVVMRIRALRAAVPAALIAASTLVLGAQSAVPARTAPPTIEALMSAPFPTDLVAAPSAGLIAWVASRNGVHNVWMSAPPGHDARALTTYTSDDGLWITDLAWTSDAKAVAYVRG